MTDSLKHYKLYKDVFSNILHGKDMPQKPSVTCLDLILMIPKLHTFFQSKLFIAVLHTVTTECLSMCARSLLSAQTWQEGLGLVLVQRFLPCRPSPSHLHLPIPPHLLLYGSPEGWTGGSNPKETVLLQGTTCPSLATFPSLVLILFNFLAPLKGRHTPSASLSLESRKMPIITKIPAIWSIPTMKQLIAVALWSWELLCLIEKSRFSCVCTSPRGRPITCSLAVVRGCVPETCARLHMVT